MVGISFILFCFSLIIRRLYLNEVHPLSLAFFKVCRLSYKQGGNDGIYYKVIIALYIINCRKMQHHGFGDYSCLL